MITDYFIDCELHVKTETTDPMGGKIWTYAKSSDIQGVMYPSKDKTLINGEWKYVDNSIFMTTDTVLKGERVKYKGQLYQCTSKPEDPMEIGHHLEIKMELIDNV